MESGITINTSNFSITNDGDAFISQPIVAQLCGVSQQAISQYINKTRCDLNLNGSSQLSHESLELVVGHYAFDSQKSNVTALETYRTLAKSGAKAFIYHAAGYELKAVMPTKFSEALRIAADIQQEKKELEAQAALSYSYVNDET
jgi:predicted transcriptional regulator